MKLNYFTIWKSTILDKLELTNSKIDFIYNYNSFGCSIIEINNPVYHKTLQVNAKIQLGKYTKVYKNKSAYIFHELSHIIHFSKLMIKNKIIDYEGLLFFTAKNPEIIPLSEIVAEVIGSIRGGFIEEIKSRNFENWKWWRTQKAFDYAKEVIIKYHNHLLKSSIAEMADFFSSNESTKNVAKKVYKLMLSS